MYLYAFVTFFSFYDTFNFLWKRPIGAGGSRLISSARSKVGEYSSARAVIGESLSARSVVREFAVSGGSYDMHNVPSERAARATRAIFSQLNHLHRVRHSLPLVTWNLRCPSGRAPYLWRLRIEGLRCRGEEKLFPTASQTCDSKPVGAWGSSRLVLTA